MVGLMTDDNPALALWTRCSRLPFGKWLFSTVVGFKAPYFRSIKARIDHMAPGRVEVRLRKRWSVQNHIGTVHAIAICNLAELAAGTLSEVTVPPATHRWIPKGMTVEYLKKAGTNLRGVGTVEPLPVFGTEPFDMPVKVSVKDTAGQEVFRAVISMWITPRKA